MLTMFNLLFSNLLPLPRTFHFDRIPLSRTAIAIASSRPYETASYMILEHFRPLDLIDGGTSLLQQEVSSTLSEYVCCSVVSWRSLWVGLFILVSWSLSLLACFHLLFRTSVADA